LTASFSQVALTAMPLNQEKERAELSVITWFCAFYLLSIPLVLFLLVYVGLSDHGTMEDVAMPVRIRLALHVLQLLALSLLAVGIVCRPIFKLGYRSTSKMLLAIPPAITVAAIILVSAT
jgi:hypothetical protein